MNKISREIKSLAHLATITECADHLGIHRSTLRAALRAGKITFKTTLGGTTLVVVKSADKWLRTRSDLIK